MLQHLVRVHDVEGTIFEWEGVDIAFLEGYVCYTFCLREGACSG
jgi:hypothetical protein